MMNKSSRLLVIFAVAMIFVGCDPYHLKECEWKLEPELEHKDYVKPGWVSICARNRVLGREKCFLKMKYELAEKFVDQWVRMSDVKINSKTFPREILSAKICTPEKKK